MLFGEGPQIKNIAADLNKLFRQGSLLNQSGQTVEGDSTADQGTSDLLAARDPVIQEISVGMSGEQSARYTVSGTPPLSLPNSLGKPLKAWEVDVLPYQEGTGDPSPSNVRPIHGTDKVNLYCGSPNIWDEEWENGYYDSYGDPSSPSANYIRSKNYVEVTPSAQYYCVTGVTYIFCLQFYDENKGFLSQNFTFRDSVVTIPSNCHYIRFWRNESEYHYNIAINYPATVTNYNPHQGGITSITLPQTVYTGTIGSDGGESRDAMVDLGTLNWVWVVSPGIYYTYGLNRSNLNTSSAVYMCEQYKYGGVVGAHSQAYARGDNTITVYNGEDARIWLRNDAIPNDVVALKAALSGVKLVYTLVTPNEFTVTAPTIPTPTDTATTWATAEDGIVDSMEVTYVGKA